MESPLMIEKYSCYEFQITNVAAGNNPNLWVYEIFCECYPPYDDGVIESDEWFDTEQEARFAAIGHICKLEDGPGDPDYDAPSAEEMYQRAHKYRQELRGR